MPTYVDPDKRDPNRIDGPAGLSVRDPKIYVFKARGGVRVELRDQHLAAECGG